MASSAVDFLRICGRLKRLKRTGWVNNQIKEPESVADHMYRMAMCAMLIDEKKCNVDKNRCLKMAIVHDLAESLVGDITPYDGVSNEEKHRLEHEAMTTICNTLRDESPAAAEEIAQLWSEYEAGLTAEAILVKDFDKFEMILQADEYENVQKKDLSGFFDSTEGYFKTPLVQSWVAALSATRQERIQQHRQQKDE